MMSEQISVSGGDGSEHQKTSKTSTEYRKTESETHEVQRGGDFEKRVATSETHESSVKRSESVEIRRAGRAGTAHHEPPKAAPQEPPPPAPPSPSAAPQPTPAPPADWFVNVPQSVRLSIYGVEPEGHADAEQFDGDYLLDLVDRHLDGCRWEVRFAPRSRLYRAVLTAHCGVGVPPAHCGAGVPPAHCGVGVSPAPTPGIAAPAIQINLAASLEGGVPGPCWSGTSPPALDQPLTLHLDPSLTGGVAAGCRWPQTINLLPIGKVGAAHHEPPAEQQPRYDIPTRTTPAERALLAFASGSSSSGSSSSSGCGGIDCTTDCHCVCPCPCCDDGTQTPMAAPTTSVPGSPMHIPNNSPNPVRYGNGEITLAVTDLSAPGFGQDFGHTRIFSNRLGGDVDHGNGYNWLNRDLPHLEELGAGSIMVVRGTRSTNWFDLVNGEYVARFGGKNTLTHDAASGSFRLAVPNGQVTVFNDFGSSYPGQFRGQITAGGQATNVVSYVPGTALGIGEVRRSHTADGVTTIESFLYSYSGFDLTKILWRRSTDGGATTNPNPDYFDDYHNWKTKTVETRPDGATNTVYCNFVNNPILQRLAGGADTWITAVHFNDRADVDQYAYPSAVAGFNDAANDLAIAYKATSGLIRKYDYYGGAAPGYMQSEWLQEGTSGTPILQRTLQYTQVTAGDATIYPTVAELRYRDDAATQPLLTTFGYTFHSGTTAVAERTTTWPVAPAGQNGSGVAEARSEQFDPWGNTIATTNERGVVTRFTIDVVTGGQLQQLADATGLSLVTDFTLDELGRRTQSLGAWHTIDVGGVATPVRTATWWVYQDAINQVWTAQGYAHSSPHAPREGNHHAERDAYYDFTLVNPVSITITDGDHAVTDQIQAARSTTAGPLLPTDTFPQSTWSRWTHNVLDDSDQLAATRVYFAIPASGEGVKGVNYNETLFGFDSLGRQNRLVSGGGTITRTVHDPRGLPLSAWIGTNDTAATDTDPSGGAVLPLAVVGPRAHSSPHAPREGTHHAERDAYGGSPAQQLPPGTRATNGNNMVAVQVSQYDDGASGGDGNRTLQTLPVDSNPANDRITAFVYDWRNRPSQTMAAQDYYQVNTFDNLDHTVHVDQYSQATNKLIRRAATNYDNRGRAYQNLRYAVDPSTGAVGNVLTDNTWFDPVGNVLMTLPAGSQAFTKPEFDSLNRQTAQYVGYYSGAGSSVGNGLRAVPQAGQGAPTYAQAADISGATIVEQTETLWDAAGNSIQTTARQRFHDATGLGPLTQPGGAQPQARAAIPAQPKNGLKWGFHKTRFREPLS